MTKKIMIACPSNAGKPDHSTALSLSQMRLEAASRGWQADVVFRISDSMITRARNMLFSMFYFGDWTDMFFIDDDIGCAHGSFLRLMDHPVELVGGAYRSRAPNREDYVLKPLPGDHLSFDQTQKTGLMEVEAIPTGFMRITRACAERMVQAYGERFFFDSTAPEGLPKCFAMFDFELVDNMYWSEDYTFCRRFRQIGGKVHVDPFLELTHTGSIALKGSLIEYLHRTNAQLAQAMPAAGEPPSVLDQARSYLAEAAE